MPLILKTSKPVTKSGYSYDPMRDGVSQTMLGLWLECREKSRLNTLMGLTPKGCSKPLTHGTISHAAVEEYNKGLQNKTIRKLDDAYNLVKSWVEIGYTSWKAENPNADSYALEFAEESAAILFVLLPRYFKFWWSVDASVSWEKVEERFRVSIGAAADIVGQYDGVFRPRGALKELWLMETKNKAQFADRMMEFLPLDSQLGIYLTALHHSTQEDPTGVRYNLIRRPGERRKVNESLTSFVSRIESNVAKDPAHYFVRYNIKLDAWEKREHRARTVRLVNSFVHWWKTEDHSKRDLLWNSQACDGRYGVCPNLSICSHRDKSFHYVREHVSPELQGR